MECHAAERVTGGSSQPPGDSKPAHNEDETDARKKVAQAGVKPVTVSVERASQSSNEVRLSTVQAELLRLLQRPSDSRQSSLVEPR